MCRRYFTFLSLVVLFLATGCKQEVPMAPPLRTAERVDSLFTYLLERDKFHGGVVVTHRGTTIYENYVGLANRSWNIPVDRETVFDVASVNKSMIAALVLKAVEEGKLDLRDRLVDVFANIPYSGSFHSGITLHMMLCHTAGLPDYEALAEPLKQHQYSAFKRMRFGREEYVDFISKLRPVGAPGEQFYYSNFAYHLLALVLEQTYDLEFGLLLQEKLARPLGMNHTFSVSNNEEVLPKLAGAYTYQESTGQWLQNPYIDLSLGRRVFSTAADLNKWALAMDTPGWLSAESLALIQQNHLGDIDPRHSYGYGWVVVDQENHSERMDLGISLPYIVHGGSTDGYRSMVANINHGTYAISFLSNVGGRTEEGKLLKELVNIIIRNQ